MQSSGKLCVCVRQMTTNHSEEDNCLAISCVTEQTNFMRVYASWIIAVSISHALHGSGSKYKSHSDWSVSFHILSTKFFFLANLEQNFTKTQITMESVGNSSDVILVCNLAKIHSKFTELLWLLYFISSSLFFEVHKKVLFLFI